MSSGMLYGKEEQEQFRHFTASETVTNKERGSRRCEHKGAEYENYCNQVRQGFLMFTCGREEACTVNGRGGITLSFTPGSPSCHSTTYMALSSHGGQVGLAANVFWTL